MAVLRLGRAPGDEGAPRSRRRVATFAALLAGALGACRSGPWKRGEGWTFALTESASEELFDASSKPWPAPSPGESVRGGVEDLWIVAFYTLPIAVPVALDVAFLPITLPHDLVVD